MRVPHALALSFALTSSFAQDHPLYRLDRRLIDGDVLALYDIAPYFDSTRVVVDHLGHHLLDSELSSIAKRIVKENCSFTSAEFIIGSGSTARVFRAFLDENRDRIRFSERTGSFLITSYAERRTVASIREISIPRKLDLKARAGELLSPDWVKETGIDQLIAEKDPSALEAIVEELFRMRSRWNRYHFREIEFLELLQHLTEVEVGFRNDQAEVEWNVGPYCTEWYELNLLIHYASTARQHRWDPARSIFVMDGEKVEHMSREEKLFQLLDSKNDSLANDAFWQLTTADTAEVIRLADQYKRAGTDPNRSLPLFPFKFLPQLSRLTAYCLAHGIDHIGPTKLQGRIARLERQMTFAERRSLEDDLIATLSLEEVTSFEYWTILKSDDLLSFSAGRILDVFYSQHWEEIVGGPKELQHYRTKAALFDDLGIIGVCNNYMKKFGSGSPKDLVVPPINSTWEGYADHEVKDLERRIRTLTRRTKDLEQNQDTLSELLSWISYQQIPLALELIESYQFDQAWQKYSFMERDWGLHFALGNFDEPAVRSGFIKVYSGHSEYELYSYYLAQAGIVYKLANGGLDYDRIYDLLKYDVVVALVGGGGGAQANEVFALIRLLDLTFGTTLGYSPKFCHSNNTWGCSVHDRATAWMKYLADHELLNGAHNDPPSFAR